MSTDNSKMRQKLRRWIEFVETGTLVVLFLILLGIPVLEILFRNMLSLGWSWSHELVQMAVLWVMMVGAIVAIRHGGHIRLDILERFLPARFTVYTARIGNLLAAIVCFIFAYYAIQEVIFEFHDQTPGIGVIPFWIFVAIIPLSALVMGVRFALVVFLRASK